MENNFKSGKNLDLDINQKGVDAEDLKNVATSVEDMVVKVDQEGAKSRSKLTHVVALVTGMVLGVAGYYFAAPTLPEPVQNPISPTEIQIVPDSMETDSTTI